MLQLDVRFKASKSMIHTIDKILETSLSANTCDEGMDMFMAAHELIINSIAAMINKNSSENDYIRLVVEVDKDHITIKVIDSCDGINTVQERLNYNQFDDTLCESGRGLMIINALVDDFFIDQSIEAKTVYTIRKKLK